MILTAGALGGGVLPVVGGFDIEDNGGGLAVRQHQIPILQLSLVSYSLQNGVR